MIVNYTVVSNAEIKIELGWFKGKSMRIIWL